jgi:hypothetical protein
MECDIYRMSAIEYHINIEDRPILNGNKVGSIKIDKRLIQRTVVLFSRCPERDVYGSDRKKVCFMLSTEGKVYLGGFCSAVILNSRLEQEWLRECKRARMWVI